MDSSWIFAYIVEKMIWKKERIKYMYKGVDLERYWGKKESTGKTGNTFTKWLLHQHFECSKCEQIAL